MAGTTPIHGLPYPDGSDPINEGDDKIHELALAVEDKLGRMVAQGMSAVTTTNAAGGGSIAFPAPFGVAHSVVMNSGDQDAFNGYIVVLGSQRTSVSCGFLACDANGGGVPNRTLRIEWVAIGDRLA